MARVIVGPYVAREKFEEGKQYKWEPNDIVELTGQQFADLVNTIKMHITSPGGAPILSLVHLANILDDTLKRGVEQGVIVENKELDGVPLPAKV